jgi:hypothetical protein
MKLTFLQWVGIGRFHVKKSTIMHNNKWVLSKIIFIKFDNRILFRDANSYHTDPSLYLSL